jgi:host factor-I protein
MTLSRESATSHGQREDLYVVRAGSCRVTVQFYPPKRLRNSACSAVGIPFLQRGDDVKYSTYVRAQIAPVAVRSLATPTTRHASFTRIPAMTQEPPQEQDTFLYDVRAGRTRVLVFLVNCICLVGSVESFDQHSVVLRAATGVQLVYRHAISTLQYDVERTRPIRSQHSSSHASYIKIGKQTAVIARKRRHPTVQGRAWANMGSGAGGVVTIAVPATSIILDGPPL